MEGSEAEIGGGQRSKNLYAPMPRMPCAASDRPGCNQWPASPVRPPMVLDRTSRDHHKDDCLHSVEVSLGVAGSSPVGRTINQMLMSLHLVQSGFM
jgi:hypothetical protein